MDQKSIKVCLEPLLKINRCFLRLNMQLHQHAVYFSNWNSSNFRRMTVQKKTKRGRAPPREIWLFFKQQTHSPSCHLTVCAPQTSVTWQWLLNEGQSNYIVQSVTFLLLIGITDFARLNAILNSNTFCHCSLSFETTQRESEWKTKKVAFGMSGYPR